MIDTIDELCKVVASVQVVIATSFGAQVAMTPACADQSFYVSSFIAVHCFFLDRHPWKLR